MQLVFVYGSLRRDQTNHALLEESEFMGQCLTTAHFCMYDLGPYSAAVAGEQRLVGEVYRVSDRVFQALDQLEDYPLEYDRQQILTPFGLAWIYIYQLALPLQILVSDGDWSRYLQERNIN